MNRDSNPSFYFYVLLWYPRHYQVLSGFNLSLSTSLTRCTSKQANSKGINSQGEETVELVFRS